MARTPHDITDTELAVLQILWDQGPVPIRKITEILYPEGKPSQYATVQKLLERLENKDFVARGRDGTINVFKATVDRDELLGRRLQTLAEKLCGGSWTPLLTNLVQNQKLSVHERQSLRRLVESLEPDPKKGPRP